MRGEAIPLCLPDLKIIQTGEKLCISFAVIIYRKARQENYARLNESFGQAKSTKPYYIIVALLFPFCCTERE